MLGRRRPSLAEAREPGGGVTALGLSDAIAYALVRRFTWYYIRIHFKIVFKFTTE